MPLPRLAVLVCAAALAACNEGPFLDTSISTRIDKPADSVIKSGGVAVCYEDDGQFAEAERLAREACASYGLEARLMTRQLFQCRLTTPHRATFRCIHPDMVDAKGRFIDPFDERTVKEWRQRTGKAVPPAVKRNPDAPTVGVEARSPAAPPLGAPAPAPVPLEPPAAVPPPSRQPPAAADVPSWPQPPAPPVPPPAPIGAPGPAAPEAFTLPVGSWGDAFDRE